MEIEYEYKECPEGEGTWLEAVIAKAYAECTELQVCDYPTTYDRIVKDTTENGRLEVRAKVDGVVAAVAIIVLDADLHVGQCVGMQWAYVLPEYRHLGLLKGAYLWQRSLARALGIPYAYTTRTGEGQYILKYRGYSNG